MKALIREGAKTLVQDSTRTRQETSACSCDNGPSTYGPFYEKGDDSRYLHVKEDENHLGTNQDDRIGRYLR